MKWLIGLAIVGAALAGLAWYFVLDGAARLSSTMRNELIVNTALIQGFADTGAQVPVMQ